jgi:hypothetical protein
VPRAVYIDAQRFTADNCLLTASLKLCRGKLEKRYQAVRTAHCIPRIFVHIRT